MPVPLKSACTAKLFSERPFSVACHPEGGFCPKDLLLLAFCLRGAKEKETADPSPENRALDDKCLGMALDDNFLWARLSTGARNYLRRFAIDAFAAC